MGLGAGVDDWWMGVEGRVVADATPLALTVLVLRLRGAGWIGIGGISVSGVSGSSASYTIEISSVCKV